MTTALSRHSGDKKMKFENQFLITNLADLEDELPEDEESEDEEEDEEDLELPDDEE
jgi:hypothetical protein